MNLSSNAAPLPEPSCLKISHADPNIYSTITHRLLFHFSRTRPDTPIVIVCVGTDRSTGDSLGPLVGTALSRFHSPCSTCTEHWTSLCMPLIWRRH